MNTAQQTEHNYVDPAGPMALVNLVFSSYVVLSAIGIGLDLMSLNALALHGSSFGYETQTVLRNLMTYLIPCLLIAMAISFLVWFQTCRNNLQPLGASYLTMRPLDAMESFVYPVLNLFRPPQILDEIWKASDPNKQDTYDSTETNQYIRYWWICWLLTWVAQIGVSFLAEVLIPDSMDPTHVVGRYLGSIAFQVVSIVAAALAIVLVTKTSERQAQRYAKFIKAQ